MEKIRGKNFVWLGLRIGFWTMVALMVVSYFVPAKTTGFLLNTLSLLYFVSIIFTFVTSIVHLVRYKQKAFAIVALVISSLIILLILMALAGGYVGTV